MVENGDVVAHLSDFVNDEQHLFFAPVSFAWNKAWARRPKTTGAVMANTTVTQLVQTFRALLWAYANGCPFNMETCHMAAGGGHLPLLQWLRANGCLWDETTCYEAAGGGHLGVLQWARTNGCLWHEKM